MTDSGIPVDGERIDAADVRQQGLDASKAATPVVGQTYYATDTGKVYVCFSVGVWSEVSGVSTGMLLYWTGAVAAIPTGWAEKTGVRGRVIVGVPSGGTVAGTVGTALTNQQDKTHTHTGPSHTHETPFMSNGSNVGTKLAAEFGNGSTSITGVTISTGGALTTNAMLTNTGGTGATGTAATSDVLAYIQYAAIEKS